MSLPPAMSHLQVRPDPFEAATGPLAVRLAEDVLAVARFLEQGGQGLRGLLGHGQVGDREALAFARGPGLLVADPPHPEEVAEALVARQDHGPDVAAELELGDRGLDGLDRSPPALVERADGLRLVKVEADPEEQ